MPKTGITGLTTTYPGTVRVDFTVTNTGSVTYTFAVGLSLGNYSLDKWYDLGYFNDGKTGDCVPSGEDPAGYVCMTLAPGESGSDYRTMEIPNDPDVTDVWIAVKDPDKFYDAPGYGVLDTDLRQGVITVPGTAGANVIINNVS